MKRIAAAVGALLLLLVVVLPITVLLLRGPIINSAPVRHEVADLLLRLTGREVDIQGRLEVDDFPWISIVVGPGTLANPPGFEGPPLLAWQQIRVRLHYSAAYSPSPRIDRIVVTGAVLNLLRDAQGRDNWSDLGPLEDLGPPQAPLTIPQIELRDAAVLYRDALSGQEPLLEAVRLGATINEIHRGAGAKEGSHWQIGSTTLAGDATLRFASDTDGTVTRPLSLRAKSVDLQIPENSALGAKVDDLAIGYGVLQLALRSVSLESTTITARFSTGPAAIDALLALTGTEPSFVSGPTLLQLRSLTGRATLVDDELTLDELDARIDRIRLRGEVTLADPIRLALDLDVLDVDDYAAMFGNGSTPSPGAPLVFPGRLLQELPLAGRLRIGEIRSGSDRLKGVTLQLHSRPGARERTADKPGGISGGSGR